MRKIGLISDTHGHFEEKLIGHFSACDEIWHAGDIGNIELADKLAALKPLRAVYGNIDGHEIRAVYPRNQRFKCEQVDVWMTHIGGYPNRYDPGIRNQLFASPPDLFITGHSHILKVMYDKKLKLLYINPGAIGKSGFHKVRTAVRFVIDGCNIRDLEVIEFQKRY
ncbi:MAG: metallophosphoesterase family protein [Bacteroidota bacterium]